MSSARSAPNGSQRPWSRRPRSRRPALSVRGRRPDRPQARRGRANGLRRSRRRARTRGTGDGPAAGGPRPAPAPRLHGEDPPLALARSRLARRSERLQAPGPRPPRLHGRRLGRRAHGRHPDDAGLRRTPFSARHRRRRRRPPCRDPLAAVDRPRSSRGPSRSRRTGTRRRRSRSPCSSRSRSRSGSSGSPRRA